MVLRCELRGIEVGGKAVMGWWFAELVRSGEGESSRVVMRCELEDIELGGKVLFGKVICRIRQVW